MNWAMTIGVAVGVVALIGIAYVVLLAVLDRFQTRRRRDADPGEEEHLDRAGTVGEVSRHPGEAARHHEDVDDVVREPHDE